MAQHREYFYTLDTRGNLIHDGAILDDPHFLDFFFRRLRVNDSGSHTDYSYYAPCGSEWNYVACADTPLIFQRIEEDKLYYAPTLWVEFNPRDLRFGTNGVLYHRAPVGQWGRMLAPLAIELARSIEPWGAWFRYRKPLERYAEVIPPLQMPEAKQLLRPREENQCAGCGKANPYGLYLSFVFDSEQKIVESWLNPDIQYMGSLNTMHGGYVALLLDETMGKVLSGMQVKAPTAQLNVRYRKPVPIGKELYLRGELREVQGRKHHLHGSIRLAEQLEVILAECEALFIALKQQPQ